MTTTTRTTSTGHILTYSTANPLWLRIEGDADTMDNIPENEVEAMATELGMTWGGEVVDDSTLLLLPAAGEWCVAGKGDDRDFGRVMGGGNVAWVRGACRTPAPEGADWFATREEAEAACIGAPEIEVTRYTQDGTTYICAGDRSTDEDAAKVAAEASLRTGETLADDLDRVDGCCTWTVEVRS